MDQPERLNYITEVLDRVRVKYAFVERIVGVFRKRTLYDVVRIERVDLEGLDDDFESIEFTERIETWAGKADAEMHIRRLNSAVGMQRVMDPRG